MKPRILWLAAAGGAMLVAAIIFIVAISLGNNTKPDSPETPSLIERSLTGNDVATDQKAVLNAATELLQLANGPLAQNDYAALMEQINSGAVATPAELSAHFHLVGKLADDPEVEKALHQALVTLSMLAKNSSGSETVAPLFDNAYEGVVLDPEVGVAYVPLTLFIESASGVNGFSFEFVWLDGEWKLAPYMLLDELRLALVYQGDPSAVAK